MFSDRFMESWQWIFGFLVILIIVRMLPRIIKHRKMKLQRNNGVTSNQSFLNESKTQPIVKKVEGQSFTKDTKPESKEMMVLGQIIRDYKTFGEIRKKTGLDSEELNSILEDLENRGLMKVEQKKGLLGIKVEILPTEKGYREYDS